MTDTPAPPEQTPENMETRLPYDAEFVKHVEEFSGKMLATLPEMQGVAIIPIWAHQPEDFPPGFLRLRAQNRLYMPELLKLMSLLTAFAVEAHKDFMNQIKVLDNYLQEMSSKLKETETAFAQSDENATQN
jgi:hypothetical protein